MLNLIYYGLVAFLIYMVLDVIWTKLVAQKIYKNEVGAIIKDEPNYLLLIVVNFILVFGLSFFVINNAILEANIVFAILGGLVYGFIVACFYTITNLAILKEWNILISLIDIAWACFVNAVTAGIIYLIFI